MALTELAAMQPAAKPNDVCRGAATVTTSDDVNFSALAAAAAVATASACVVGLPLVPADVTGTVMVSLGFRYACTAATASKSYSPSANQQRSRAGNR